MSGRRFVFELKMPGQEPHKIIFPNGVGRRELHSLGGTHVGNAILDAKGLRVEFMRTALERLLEAKGL